MEDIFKTGPAYDFQRKAMEIFGMQYTETAVYREFCNHLGKNPGNVTGITSIPFLPVTFFKSRDVLRDGRNPELIFRSSGTTDSALRSRHLVSDSIVYRNSLLESFKTFVGQPSAFRFYSLLPGYSERPDSSLIWMVEELGKAGVGGRVFHFSGNVRMLHAEVEKSNRLNEKNIVFGVTHALLNYASLTSATLPFTTIIETGGMKGRGKEITRPELYSILLGNLKPVFLMSEYGMTEMLSQAYAGKDGIYHGPPWMKVLVRDVTDPGSVNLRGEGLLNIIDLANYNSCSFIASEDLGRVREDGGFEVLGRSDHSEVRGCNLLYAG